MGLADRADDIRDLDAAAQGDVVGGLDDGAVQDRVAVRQPDLDDVAAAVQHRRDRPYPVGDGGEPGGEVADECGPVLRLGHGQYGAQQLDVARHHFAPSAPSS
ncbi:hypothetical protein GCM10020000_60470 [Streptomyces olivoverticillatus]